MSHDYSSRTPTYFAGDRREDHSSSRKYILEQYGTEEMLVRGLLDRAQVAISLVTG